MAKISKDTPLAEFTLRRYEKPSAKGRELVRKLCLSVGLLQPGDSRDVIVDILHVLLKADRELNTEQIREQVIEQRKQKNLPLIGIAASNIRRQLKRLRGLMIVEKKYNNYRMMETLSMNNIMEEKLEKMLFPSVIDRVKEYFDAVDQEFRKEE